MATTAKVYRDGVGLVYRAEGDGDPPMVFVHGWTCDHTFFAPQAAYFGRRHRVISVDLRGHGESDKPEAEYSPDAFADDVAYVCRQLGLDRAIVVGHSLGGVIALAMAARHADLVRAIVTVDAPIFPLQWVRDAVAGLLEQLRGPGYREAQMGFVANALFLPTDEAPLKEQIVESMSRAPQHVLVPALGGIFSWDHAAAAAACKVPALAITAAVATADLARFREACPHLVVGQTVGSGHFNQLVVPEQVNAMIDRFITTAVTPASIS